MVDDLHTEEIEPQEKVMTFFEHLGELRTRLIRALIYVLIGAIITGVFWEEIFKILLKPAGIKSLVALGPIDMFMAKFKLSLYSGLVLTLPFIIYEIMAFIAPALKRKERRVVLPLIFLSVILFYSGVVVGYFFIMPPGIKWLLEQGGTVMEAFLTTDRYLAFSFMFLAGVGISFETPIVVYLLSKMGLVTPRSLLVNWRYAIVIIFTVAAILTPDWSPVTMALFALPMVILYFLSILLVKFL